MDASSIPQHCSTWPPGATVYARDLVDTATQAGLTLSVPAAALAAAWAATGPFGRLSLDLLLAGPCGPGSVDELDSVKMQ